MTSQAAKLALAVLVVAITTAARADGERSSLLQCGVNLGGKTLTYHSGSETKDKKDNRLNHVVGAVTAQPLQFTTAVATNAMSATAQGSDTRLPPKLTLATFGCSWR